MEPRSWLPDPSHYPEQMTPLSASVWFEALGRGLHEAARELRAPFGGFVARTELGWAYEGELDPDWEHDPATVRDAALGLHDRWPSTYRPRTWEITHELWQMRPELPPPADAVRLLDRLWQLVQEQWTIHFLVVIPAQIAAEIFDDRYRELFPAADPLAPYRLLETPRSEAELVKLARRARELRLDQLIRELTPPHALDRLQALTHGRLWLAELGEYLHPDRGRGGRARWHELSLPREAELPQLTFDAVRLYLDREPPPPSPPEPLPDELRELYELCSAAFALKEEHSYHIDYPGLLATRETLLGFGRRLAAEALLDQTDEIWMLTRSQLRQALTEHPDLKGLVSRARDELADGLRQGPKPFLGVEPARRERHPALDKFYGAGGHALAGAGASPGIAEGTARVVAVASDFGRIQPGDILVTTTTTPAWTPLFPTLAALVTETGGILSHAAVVAREYGIPAVVGAAGATSAIPDGGRVRVDGAAGTVLVL